MIGRSLSTRLLVALVAAQAGAIMLAMITIPLFAPFVSLNDIADATFRDKINSAIVANPDGSLTVHPDRALTHYQARRPGAHFAVMSLRTGQVIAGSDPQLAPRLEQIRSLAPRVSGNLITDQPDGVSLIITTQDTAHGRLLFATAGNSFHVEDWPSLMAVFLPIILPAYGPVIFGAFVLLPLIVRLVTRPLRRLAAQAALVAPGQLQMRLDDSGLGIELQRLTQAVNAALARIEEGVARQRLYAANAAHELRTPIAILGLHVDQLEPSERRSRLQSDVSRIRTLVEQMVTVARLGQNHVAMDEVIDLAALVRDVIADRAPIAVREARELEFNAEISGLVVFGNRQALFSALANIVDNAIRAEPAGGVVSVALNADAEVLIADHGAGIPPANRACVFEPFWRGHSAQGGAGLGLAIVKEICDRHDIDVAIIDTKGGGATFRLRFPRDRSKPLATVSIRQ